MLSEEKARLAVGIVCTTARGLQLTSLEESRKLSFDQVLARAGRALKGVKDLLAVYGISLDAILDSVTVETVEESETAAKLKVSVEFLGEREIVMAEMVLRDALNVRMNNFYYGYVERAIALLELKQRRRQRQRTATRPMV